MILNGSVKLQRSSFNSLTVNGFAEVEEVTFSKMLKVNGSLNVSESKLHDVIVNGSASFVKCRSTGLIQVSGTIDVVACEFTKLEVVNTVLVLDDCIVQTVIMKKLSIVSKILSFLGNTQKIILQDTVISGDIIFETTGGVVELHGASRVKGNVIGGEIMQEL